MPANPYIIQTGPQSEKNLLDDLWQEAISFYGQNMFYIPRETVVIDELFGDDRASKFKNAYPMAMMVENTSGYDGQDLYQKFGVEIRDDATLVVSRREFHNELISTPHRDLKRPREGDLIFVPFSNSLFEIMFVEHEQPFYIWNQLPAYKFNVSLFEYNNEEIDTGLIGLDIPSSEQTPGQGLEAESYLLRLTLASGGAFQLGEMVTQTYTNGTIVVGKIVKIENAGQILYMSNVSHDDTSSDYNVFIMGRNIVSETTNITRNVTGVSEVMFDFAKNMEIETAADAVLDFTETNPFGEP